MTFTFSTIGKLEPYFVGFDQLFDRLTKFEAAKSGSGPDPPYNIVKRDDEQWTIEIAVAGFSEPELTIEHNPDECSLMVMGEGNDNDGEYIHKGISSRNFKRTWTLQDHVEVSSADLTNGLLRINLKRVIPESKRPRKISIGNKELLSES